MDWVTDARELDNKGKHRNDVLLQHLSCRRPGITPTPSLAGPLEGGIPDRCKKVMRAVARPYPATRPVPPALALRK
jgi:hypothetical protein